MFRKYKMNTDIVFEALAPLYAFDVMLVRHAGLSEKLLRWNIAHQQCGINHAESCPRQSTSKNINTRDVLHHQTTWRSSFACIRYTLQKSPLPYLHIRIFPSTSHVTGMSIMACSFSHILVSGSALNHITVHFIWDSLSLCVPATSCVWWTINWSSAGMCPWKISANMHSLDEEQWA